MDLQHNFKYELIATLSSCISGYMVAVEIQNFNSIVAITQNVNVFETMMVELQKQIQNQFSASVSRYSHNIFFIILNSDIVVETEIINLIHNFHIISDENIYMRCAIGCVPFVEKDRKNLDLVHKSLIALQNAIEMDCVYYVYDSLIDDEIEIRKKEMGVANSVMKAVSKNNVAIALQPIVDVNTEEIIFYEGLLRLVDKKNNSVMLADSFIPISEKMGIISILDNVSFDLIKEELSLGNSINIAMNVSVKNIQDRLWRQNFMNKLYDFPLAKRLIIEITETWYKRPYDVISDFILEVKKVGCKVALDDFGAGYGSILEVIKMDIDFLKVDKLITEDIHKDERKLNALKLIKEMAECFGVEVIAEFIFCEEQIESLKQIGIKYMQGFKIGKPTIKIH